MELGLWQDCSYFSCHLLIKNLIPVSLESLPRVAYKGMRGDCVLQGVARFLVLLLMRIKTCVVYTCPQVPEGIISHMQGRVSKAMLGLS